MSFSLLWLPDVLQAAGLKVAVVPGWETRGRREMGAVSGVLCHHTANPNRTQNMPSLNGLISGRPDLNGPLSQLGLGRDGTFYVIAAGLANHAGAGLWQTVTDGNAHFIGIEGENTGLQNDFPWPVVQMEAYQRGVAAILRHVGRGAESCAGHREYATPGGRKIDPTFDMDDFRRHVAGFIAGTTPTRPPIPAVEPVAATATDAARPTVRRGDRGVLVERIQRKVDVSVDGDFGGGTEAAVRAFQRDHGMVPDGIVGPKSWAALDRA